MRSSLIFIVVGHLVRDTEFIVYVRVRSSLCRFVSWLFATWRMLLNSLFSGDVVRTKPQFCSCIRLRRYRFRRRFGRRRRIVCSGSVVVTAYDSESGRPGSNPEWGIYIYYEASITAQGLPEPSSLRGSTLGTRAAEHKGCNWGMQID